MRAETAKICAALLGLVVCAAAQDVAPAILGAKPPVLLAFGCFAGVPTAIASGLFVDALGGMPFGCSAVFFGLAALAARAAHRSHIAVATAIVMASAGAHQIWIAMWGGGDASTGAVCVSAACAAVLAPIARAFVDLARRRIGIDREEVRR